MNTRLWLSALSLAGLLVVGCAQPADTPATPAPPAGEDAADPGAEEEAAGGGTEEGAE